MSSRFNQLFYRMMANQVVYIRMYTCVIWSGAENTTRHNGTDVMHHICIL